MARALRRKFLGVSASYIRSAFPTPSNRPLRPRLRAYRRVALDFRTTADNILDLIANFPTHFNHRFCKPKVGSSILSTGTSKKSLWHSHFLHFRRSDFAGLKSLKARFGCIFGCTRDSSGNAWIWPTAAFGPLPIPLRPSKRLGLRQRLFTREDLRPQPPRQHVIVVEEPRRRAVRKANLVSCRCRARVG